MRYPFFIIFIFTSIISFEVCGTYQLKSVVDDACEVKESDKVIFLSSLDPENSENMKFILEQQFGEDVAGKPDAQNHVRSCFQRLRVGVETGAMDPKNFDGLFAKCNSPDESLISWIQEDLKERLWKPHKWCEFKIKVRKKTSKIIAARNQVEVIGHGLYVMLRVCNGIALQEFNGPHRRFMTLPTKENLDEWLNNNIISYLYGEKK